MYMRVPIGSCGSCDPVVTLKPLWEYPGTELSTWSIGSFCCIRAIHAPSPVTLPRHSLAQLYTGYTAIQRYTLYMLNIIPPVCTRG